MADATTRYARNGDVHVAYQIVGSGDLDLVLVPGFVSHVELQWADPRSARFLEGLASFSRLITFDKRGTGLSDPVPGLPTLEERMEDLRAVLDAVGSERAALLGVSEGGPMSLLFAATYPERTTALVLYGTFAKGLADTEHPAALPEEQFDRVIAAVDAWGEGRSIDLLGPSFVEVEDIAHRVWGAFERMAASPGMARACVQAWREVDLTGVLPAITAPTLVLHRTGDFFPIGEARYLAEHIAGARFAEVPGSDHLPWLGDTGSILAEIEEFLTGERHEVRADRILATVLFTDVVGSTKRAAEVGDEAWRDLRERHDALVRKQLAYFRGREVKSMGDGFLATFDGPARAVRCARSIVRLMPELGIEVRAGVHTGECDVTGDDIGGIAVHIGARVGALAAAGEVLVSSTVRDLVVGSGLVFDDRGLHELKGVPGEWALSAAADDRPNP
jgi:pimeloyl-ACP methyl ester carboxylesterase